MSTVLRHPAARTRRGDLALVAERLCAGLRNLHVPHPELAAAALVVRGTEGCSAASFGEAHGLTVDEVTALESGRVGIEAVPAPLRVLTPLGALHAHLLGVPSDGSPIQGEEDGAAGQGRGGHQQGSTGHRPDHRGARPGTW